MSTGTPIVAVQNMPPEYLAEFNKSRSYICNITDTEYNLARTYGNYHIPAKLEGEEFTVTEITPRKGTMDMGDKKVFDFPITPREVADDLCREVNTEAGFNSFLGVFVCAGPQPTPAELKKAKDRLNKFYQWAVAEGDKVWQQTRLVIMIPDLCKRAADHLGLNRDWKTDIQPNLECEGCGTRYKFGVAICASCGLVLDEAKARRLYPHRFEPVTAEGTDDGETLAVVDLGGDDAPAPKTTRRQKKS